MPIIYQTKDDSSVSWCLWHITETEESLFEGITLDAADKAHIQSLRLAKRRIEKLACRQALASLLPQNQISLQYSESGQPSIGAGHISFSHSGNYAAAAYSPTRRIGIDIETIGTRIERLYSHFLSMEEITIHDCSNAALLHQLWGSKEAIYKLMGKDQPPFRDNILIADPALAQGTILTEPEVAIYLSHQIIDNLMIVVAVEK